MQNCHVQSQKGRIKFALPESWHILTVSSFDTSRINDTTESLAREALAHPIAASPLEEVLTPQSRIAIIVEDLSRTSPKKEILAILLDRLLSQGIPRENLSIVIALGTHQPLTQEEMEEAFGVETVAAYTFYNHDCHAADLVPIGRLATGATVKINRHVAKADYRIGLGSIFPHPMNGFGGGCKILFPGVADFDSIVEHHFKHSFRDQACLGTLEGNPFYEEIVDVALSGGLDFIINSVLDHSDSLHDIVCGHPVKAHTRGTEICREITSVPFNGKSDVTIISAFPHTLGPQIMKPLAPAGVVTRQGGQIILYADDATTLPEHYFAACETFIREHDGQLRQAVLDHFNDNRPIMPAAPPELNMSMAQLLLALNDFSLILVSNTIPAKQIERLGVKAAATMGEAITLSSGHTHEAWVNIIPSGGIIVPLMKYQKHPSHLEMRKQP